MTFDEQVLAALRDATDLAAFIEHAGVERCPNAIVMKSLAMCAIGPVLDTALAYAWAGTQPVDTPASKVLQAAHDRFHCNAIETVL